MKLKKREIMQESSLIKKHKKSLYIGIVAFILVLVLSSVLFFRDRSILINTQAFDYALQKDSIKEAWIDGKYLYFNLGKNTYKIWRDALDADRLKTLKIKESSFSLWPFLFLGVFIVALLWIYMSRNLASPIKHLKKNDTKEINDIKPVVSQVDFSDVAGIGEVKEELEDIISFLKSPKEYEDMGISFPKGVLLVGPPGVGKTLIAKALAKESGVPFFYQSGASFVQIYAGMGAKRVRELFKVARRMSPSIIFIDEIDAVGKARGGNRSDERESTLNELLTQLDGMHDNSTVIVLGATNHIEMLDSALLRSGRFDRKIEINLPNLSERIKILELHFRDKKHHLDLEAVARSCVGFSGAALATLANEAALYAHKKKHDSILIEDINAVHQKVFLGKRMPMQLDEDEKKILSIYQASKIVCALDLKLRFDSVMLLGEFLLSEERGLLSEENLKDRICFYLSGIAGFDVFYNQRYVYGQADLKRVLAIEAQMRDYEMLDSSYQREGILAKCVDKITKHRDLIATLSQALLNQERLSYSQIQGIVDEARLV